MLPETGFCLGPPYLSYSCLCYSILSGWLTLGLVFFFFLDCARSWLWHVGSFTCGLQNLWLQHVESSSLTRDWTWAACIGSQSLNHWVTREVLWLIVDSFLSCCKATASKYPANFAFKIGTECDPLLTTLTATITFKPPSSLLVAQSCRTLCHLMDSSPPGSSVHGFLQARILEMVDVPFSRGSSWPRDWTWVSCFAGRSFTVWTTSIPTWDYDVSLQLFSSNGAYNMFSVEHQNDPV